MKELKTLKIDSNVIDFISCYNYNSDIVGSIAVRLDIYANYIKVLCVFPLRDKKLEYFLKLDRKAKTGYMSSYIMSVARKINVPNSIIDNFQRLKRKTKVYKELKPTPEQVGSLYGTDIKKFLSEYSSVVKEEVYTNELSVMTENLCSAIFEQYDKARAQMVKEQQL